MRVKSAQWIFACSILTKFLRKVHVLLIDNLTSLFFIIIVLHIKIHLENCWGRFIMFIMEKNCAKLQVAVLQGWDVYLLSMMNLILFQVSYHVLRGDSEPN